MELDQFHRELQARILGSVAMVQAFLPLNSSSQWKNRMDHDPGADSNSVRNQHSRLRFCPCGGIQTPAGLRTTTDVETLLQ